MKNELKHLAEFQELLKNYRASEELVNQLDRGDFVILTAPTSIGRNTIIKKLVETGNYRFLVSDTTRHPRFNNGVMENNGGPYWFKTEEEVLEGIRKHNYITPAIVHSQQVSAISMEEVKKTYDGGKIPLTEIEVQGVEEISHYKGDVVAIFVLPPSFDEWMRRFNKRGKMNPTEIRNRLESAIDEFNYALDNSNKLSFIINDNLDKAVEIIEKIVKTSGEQLQEDKKPYLGRVDNLIRETKKLLSTLD